MLLALVLPALALAETVYLIEVCRHGARSPIAFDFPWDNYERWPQGPGQLTPSGMRQHYLIGHELRQRYQYSFLAPNYTQPQLRVVSTDVNRTLQSALSQMMGLYPPGSGPLLREIGLEHVAVPPLNNSQIMEETIKKLGMDALLHKTQLVPIHTKKISRANILLPEETCQKYQNAIASRSSTEMLQSLINKYKQTIQSVMDFTGETDMKKGVELTLRMYDSIKCNDFHKYNIPADPFNKDYFKQNVSDFYNEATQFVYYGTDFEQRVAGSDFLSAVVEQFEEAQSSDYLRRFMFYSAHDTTLLNVKAALQLDTSEQPPFASQLFFELMKNETGYYVQVRFNDMPVKFPTCSDYTCTYSEFKGHLMNRILYNVTEACTSGKIPGVSEQSSKTSDFGGSGSDDGSIKWYAWFVIFYCAVVLIGVLVLIYIKRRKTASTEEQAILAMQEA
mmetsp:Transcript_1421/g.2260  ORF Transcript_1421/g.2260 Transcript_1421/m.2260 type:complete len:448 (-) Transcript_1421:769-2112(-)